MAALMEVVPLIEDDNPVSMANLAEKTATGSLPMYLLFLAYQNSPYVVTLFLILGLVAFVLTYYRMMSPSKKTTESKSLLQARGSAL
mmetsp:Transcript_6404/g.11140  ORF Transcript_6404/g.11140 Transcript_6404/m.11140 type:complete len:87 (-) Transcript_6404:1753-2013(-)